jgi:type IV pilus assembly protein PilA
MLSKMREMLKSQKGFTLIELITVIVILGVILGIGLPKYAKMQAQSEYDSDVATLRNFAKAAEVYWASTPGAKSPVSVDTLDGAGLFDKTTVLKRQKGSGTASVRNSGQDTMSKKKYEVTIDATTGMTSNKDSEKPTDGIPDWIETIIGDRPK